MDSFYPFKIRRTFAPSNNDKAFFNLLTQPKFQKAGIEKKTQRHKDTEKNNSVTQYLCVEKQILII